MYRFDAELWRTDGEVAWHFVTLPAGVSDDIDERTAGNRRGFGSVRVEVRLGAITWATSVFPDTKREAYVLPVKADVRRRAGIEAGDPVTLELEVVDGR